MPGDKLPVKDFAAKIKAKYPQYKDIDDAELTQRIVEKYPEYGASVDLSGLKKKESGGSVSQPFSKPVATGIEGLKGTDAPEGYQQQKQSFEKAQAPEVEDDPLGNTVRKAAVRKQEIKQQHSGRDATYVAGNYQNISKEVDAIGKEERAAQNFRFDATSDAKGVLEKLTGNVDNLSDEQLQALDVKDNLTYLKAKEQVLDQRSINKILQGNSTFESAAVQFAALKDPKIAKQIEAQGGKLFASKSQKGAAVSQFLGQPAVREWARQSQQNMNTFKAAQNNFISNYPDLAASQLATILSKEREKRGLNNGLINSVSNEEMDAIVQDMVAKGDLTQQQRVVYEKLLRPQTKGLRNPYQTPGFFENLPTATKESIKGMARSVEEGVDMITPGDFVDEAVATQQDLEKDYTHVDFKPKGLWHEFSSATATLTPQVLLMGTGIKGLQALNLIKNPAVSGALMEGMQSYGTNVAQARTQFPGEPAKQMAHATLTTAFEMAMSRIFPDEKVLDGIGKAFKGKAAGVITDFAEGKLTAAAAKDLIQSDVQRILTETLPKFVGNTIKNTQKEALEEVVPQVMSDVLTDVFEGKPVDERKAWTDAFETWKQTTLGSGVISGLAAHADTPPLMRSMIYDMAQNADAISRQNLDADVLENLTTAKGIVADLDKTDLTQSQKEKVLLQELKQAVLKKELENTTAEFKKSELKENINASKEKVATILNTRAEQIKAKEVNQANENQAPQNEIPPQTGEPVQVPQVNQQQEATPVIESEQTNTTQNDDTRNETVQGLQEQNTPDQKQIQKVDELGSEAGNIQQTINQTQDERQKEGQEGLLTPDATTEGATETVAPETSSESAQTEPQQAEEGGDVKKTITTKRAYEGEFREGVKKELEKLGLTRDVESQADAKQRAKDFVASVGEDTALDAVRNNDVPDAAGAYIWNELIESVDRKLIEETDPEKIKGLEQKQAGLINELSRKALSGGRFASALGDIYQNSDLGYNVEVKIQEYKDKNNGTITTEVEEKFRKLDEQYKAVKAQLAEAEKRAKDAEAKAALAAIKEAEARKKALENRKSYQQKAKDVADKVRKLKNKPLTFKDADGNDIPVQLQGITWNDLVEAAAKIIEKTGQIADGIAHIVSELQKAEWYQKLDDRNRQAVVKQIEDYFNKEEGDTSTDGAVKIKHSLIREAVEAGNDDIDSVVAYIKEKIGEEYPDATDRDIRDAVTGYGKTINPNKEDIEVQIRKIKRIGRVISGLEDIANKKRPLRSGAQRDKLDAEERAMQKELREAMKELPVDADTESRQLKTAVDAAKQRLRNQIEDLQRQIDTGEKVERSKRALPEDGEMKDLRAERDALKEQFEQIFGNSELSDEQKIANAIKAVERSIAEYDRRIKENDLAPKKRAALPQSEALDAVRKLRDARKAELKKLQEDAGVIEKNRLEGAKKRVQGRIEDLQRRLKEGDFSKKQSKPVVDDSELIKLKAEKLRIQEEYDKEFYKAQLQNRTKAEKIKDTLWELWGITRALRATGEMSFVGVQGLIQTIAHPIHAAKAFKNALRFLSSEKKAESWLREVKAQEWYPVMKESKLGLTEPTAELSAREELFYSGWTNILWDVIGSPLKLAGGNAYNGWVNANPFKALERAAVGYLDTIRVERFLDGMQMLQEKGKDFQNNKQDYKDVADAINTMTGRASLGKAELVAPQLAKVFFSPRNWASAIKTATPYALYHFGKMTPTGRKMAVADMAKFVGLTTGMVMAAAAYYNNDDDDETGVELDPRSSDFGKIKIGNKRIDPWGGRIQMIVLQARLVMDAVKNDKGKIIPLGTPYKAPTRKETLLRMATNKLAPTAQMVNKYLGTRLKKENGQMIRVDEFGNPYSFNQEIVDNLYPIYWDTVHDLIKDDPSALDGVLLFYSFFGGNVDVREDKKQKSSGGGQVVWK